MDEQETLIGGFVLITAWLAVHFIGGYRYKDSGPRYLWQCLFYPTAVIRQWWQEGKASRRALMLPLYAVWIAAQVIPWAAVIIATSLALTPLRLAPRDSVQGEDMWRYTALGLMVAIIVHFAYFFGQLHAASGSRSAKAITARA